MLLGLITISSFPKFHIGVKTYLLALNLHQIVIMQFIKVKNDCTIQYDYFPCFPSSAKNILSDGTPNFSIMKSTISSFTSP